MKRLILLGALAPLALMGPAHADPGLMGHTEAQNIKSGDTFNTVQDICGPPSCNPFLDEDHTLNGVHWKDYTYADTEGGQVEVDFIVHADGSRHAALVYWCGSHLFDSGLRNGQCDELL